MLQEISELMRAARSRILRSTNEWRFERFRWWGLARESGIGITPLVDPVGDFRRPARVQYQLQLMHEVIIYN